MEAMMVSVEQYRDTCYNIGYAQGKKMDSSLLAKFEVLVNERFNVEGVKEVFHEFAPHLLDELQGLADALHIPFSKAAALFSGYDIPTIKGMGCSSVVNSTFAVRNYDFSPELYDNRFVLLQPREGFASVGHSLHIIGRHEGVNEKGLFIALHFVNNQQPNVGLTASSIVRMVLDTCESTKDAIALLKQVPHAWSYNFSIGDGSGTTAVVEVSPEGVRVREGSPKLMCTNHFQHKDMEQMNRTDYTNSFTRLSYLTKKSMDKVCGEEIFNWFRNPNSEMFYTDYDNLFGTLHTFAYIFESQTVLTAVANGEPLAFTFKNWVDGSNIEISRLNGELILS